MKKISTFLALSTFLTSVGYATTPSNLEHEQAIRAGKHYTSMDKTESLPNQWWSEFEASNKPIAQYVSEISQTKPEAALWFLLTGGKNGFSKRVGTKEEQTCVVNAMMKVAAYVQNKQASDKDWQFSIEKYDRDHQNVKVLYHMVEGLNVKVKNLEQDVKFLKLELISVKDELVKTQETMKTMRTDLTREKDTMRADLLREKDIMRTDLLRESSVILESVKRENLSTKVLVEELKQHSAVVKADLEDSRKHIKGFFEQMELSEKKRAEDQEKAKQERIQEALKAKQEEEAKNLKRDELAAKEKASFQEQIRLEKEKNDKLNQQLLEMTLSSKEDIIKLFKAQAQIQLELDNKYLNFQQTMQQQRLEFEKEAKQRERERELEAQKRELEAQKREQESQKQIKQLMMLLAERTGVSQYSGFPGRFANASIFENISVLSDRTNSPQLSESQTHMHNAVNIDQFSSVPVETGKFVPSVTSEVCDDGSLESSWSIDTNVESTSSFVGEKQRFNLGIPEKPMRSSQHASSSSSLAIPSSLDSVASSGDGYVNVESFASK